MPAKILLPLKTKAASVGLCLLFVAIQLSAQTEKVLYYDTHWELAQAEYACFHRKVQMDTINLRFMGQVEDRYYDGKLKMTGQYQDGQRHGLFSFYYANGQLESRGQYEHGDRKGEWQYYYSSGQPKQIIIFENDDFTIREYQDGKGIMKLKEGRGEWFYYYREDSYTYMIKGSFADGRREGNWEKRWFNNRLATSEEYKNGVMIRGTVFNTLGESLETYQDRSRISFPEPSELSKPETFEFNQLKTNVSQQDYPYLASLPGKPYPNFVMLPATDEFFSVAKHEAHFPGGLNSFYSLVYDRIQSVSLDDKLGANGNVMIGFSVAEDGVLYDFYVVQSLTPELDQLVLDAVSSVAGWVPAYIDDLPIVTTKTLTFVLKVN